MPEPRLFTFLRWYILTYMKNKISINNYKKEVMIYNMLTYLLERDTIVKRSPALSNK